MSRAFPVAVIYMLRNQANGKIYIGETVDYATRMSHYKGTPRRKPKYNTSAISQAILKYGWDAFEKIILVSEEEDPRLTDVVYRRNLEARYIYEYGTTNKKIGYNQDSYLNPAAIRHRGEPGQPHKSYTKLLKSDPLLGYDFTDKTVMMYMGAQSAAELLNIGDRSQIIRGCKRGLPVHNVIFFKLDYDERYKRAIKYLKDRKEILGKPKHANAAYGLNRYMEAARAIEEYCEEFGYKTINFDKLAKEILENNK